MLCSNASLLLADHFLAGGMEAGGAGPGGSRRPGHFPCAQCGKVYRWKWNLMAHLREDCGQRPRYNCGMCSYSSKRARNLSLHTKRVHKLPARGLPRQLAPRHAIPQEFLFH